MMKDLMVKGQYRLIERQGNGAFGEIWRAINEGSKERWECAVKFEDHQNKNQQLKIEHNIYLWLHSDESVLVQAVPRIYEYASLEDDKKNILVMDLLGKSLEDLFDKQARKFSLKTTLLLGDQMLKRLEYIHSRQIIHRDVKPDNFTLGSGLTVESLLFFLHVIKNNSKILYDEDISFRIMKLVVINQNLITDPQDPILILSMNILAESRRINNNPIKRNQIRIFKNFIENGTLA